MQGIKTCKFSAPCLKSYIIPNVSTIKQTSKKINKGKRRLTNYRRTNHGAGGE